MKMFQYICVAGLMAALTPDDIHAMNSGAVNEVLKLKNAGLGDDGLVAFIRNKNLNYDLSSDDILALKNQGVSAAVLTAMLSSVSAPAAPATVAATVPSVPSPISVAPTVAPAPTVASAVSLPVPGISPDAAYFFQQLSPYGKWIMAEDNQWYWQPSVVVTTPSWRPYWDQGHWVYTDSGWYWASDYPWGWAAFHYGRWRLHPLHGWMWAPDRVWAPAWVAWRSGDQYCGWAPLPPGAGFDAVGGLVFNGRHVAVDFDFGLDWHHFNFCLVREMAGPHLTAFRREGERRMAFNRTTVINHYTVKRTLVDNHPDVRVINHGIDPARIGMAKGRPVEPVRIQDMHTPPPNRAHERLDKGNKTLEVYRPHWGDGR